jgi:NADH dehydrogenase [ubiquinone] 1 alpha subcomplex assembly factor 6
MATIPGYVKGVRAKTPTPDQRSAAAGPLSDVAALVRRHDRDRFQTVLFAPAARRDALFALYAFNFEIARVRESVTEPTLGRMRLEWWREAVSAAYAKEIPRRHPVVAALSAVIREYHPGRELFETLIAAREADLDDDPPPDLAALEAYAEGSSSALIQLALEVLETRDGAAAEAGHHVGIAYALSGLLRALPTRPASWRPIIPADIAMRHGVDPAGRGRPGQPRLRQAVAEIAGAAEQHLLAARRIRKLQRRALPALLPGVIAGYALRQLRRYRHDPYAPGVMRADALQVWRLAAAALRGRF